MLQSPVFLDGKASTFASRGAAVECDPDLGQILPLEAVARFSIDWSLLSAFFSRISGLSSLGSAAKAWRKAPSAQAPAQEATAKEIAEAVVAPVREVILKQAQALRILYRRLS